MTISQRALVVEVIAQPLIKVAGTRELKTLGNAHQKLDESLVLDAEVPRYDKPNNGPTKMSMF